MRGRRTSSAAGLIPASSETEVLFDDLAVLLFVGVQPAANSFGRKASIREGADERPSLAQHAGHVSKHFYRSGEVVDGNAAHHAVEGLVGERQPGLGVEIVDDMASAEGFVSPRRSSSRARSSAPAARGSARPTNSSDRALRRRSQVRHRGHRPQRWHRHRCG